MSRESDKRRAVIYSGERCLKITAELFCQQLIENNKWIYSGRKITYIITPRGAVISIPSDLHCSPLVGTTEMQSVLIVCLDCSQRVSLNGEWHYHRADTKVNTDYFSLFTFHKIINVWKWKKYFKISNCGFGLELNASCNNVKMVPTGEMLLAGKFNKLWQIFVDFSCKCYCTIWYNFYIYSRCI